MTGVMYLHRPRYRNTQGVIRINDLITNTLLKIMSVPIAKYCCIDKCYTLIDLRGSSGIVLCAVRSAWPFAKLTSIHWFQLDEAAINVIAESHFRREKQGYFSENQRGTSSWMLSQRLGDRRIDHASHILHGTSDSFMKFSFGNLTQHCLYYPEVLS